MSLTAILSTQALAISARVFAPRRLTPLEVAWRPGDPPVHYTPRPISCTAPALCSARIGRVTGLARELGDRVGGGQNPVWRRGDEGPRKFCEREVWLSHCDYVLALCQTRKYSG